MRRLIVEDRTAHVQAIDRSCIGYVRAIREVFKRIHLRGRVHVEVYVLDIIIGKDRFKIVRSANIYSLLKIQPYGKTK